MNNSVAKKIISMEQEALALKQASRFAGLRAFYYEIDTSTMTSGEHTINYAPGPYVPISEITTDAFGVWAIATPVGNTQKVWLTANRGKLRIISTREIISVE